MYSDVTLREMSLINPEEWKRNKVLLLNQVMEGIEQVEETGKVCKKGISDHIREESFTVRVVAVRTGCSGRL